VIWPGYRDAIGRVRDHLLDPTRAPWFRLGLDGQRLADVVAEVPERAALGVDSKT
jgi:hypothetical protein